MTTSTVSILKLGQGQGLASVLFQYINICPFRVQSSDKFFIFYVLYVLLGLNSFLCNIPYVLSSYVCTV